MIRYFPATFKDMNIGKTLIRHLSNVHVLCKYLTSSHAYNIINMKHSSLL